MVDITINNETFTANKYECSPVLVEIGDRTRTLDGTDHVEGIKLKRNIKATFIDVKRDNLYRLVQSCLQMPITATYFDSINNQTETRKFLLQNNPSIQMKIWKKGLQFYDAVQIDLLEKEAT